MDGQMRLVALVVGFAFVIGAAALLMTSDLFNYTPVSSLETLSGDLLTADTTQRTQNRPRMRTVREATSSSPSTTSVTQLQQIRLLLEQKDLELETYRKRIQELQSTATVPQRQPNTAARDRRPAAEIRTVSQSPTDITDRNEIDRLNTLLLDADIAEAETRERIRTLEDSLDRARDQVEILEQGTSSEIDASDLQTRSREQTMADMVVKTGTDTIPLLIQMLDNNDPRVRSWAASILGRFGEDAEEAIGALRDLADDRSIEVRNTAGRALDSIRGR